MATRLPDFLVIGAMKCATTSLCGQLASHPGIFFSTPKEPEFFCRDERYARGLDEYARLFEGAGETQIVGEGSTSYTKAGEFPGTARRIAASLPDVRCIYVVRDPIRRIESQWLHTLRKRPREVVPFDEAVSRPGSPYVDPSLYWRQLLEYRSRFDDDRLLILFYEELVNAPREVLRRCYRFVGVDDDFVAPAATEAQRHASVGIPFDRPLVSRLRRSGLLRRAVRRLPHGVRRLARRPFQRVVETRPRWNPDVLDRTLDVVAEDARRLLAHCGKPEDYWPLRAAAYLEPGEPAAASGRPD